VFDKARSNEILDSLGYTERNNNGIRLKADGSPLEVELLVGSTSTERIRTSEIISLQLGEVGINVVVMPMDPDTLDEFVWPDFDTAAEHNYQMAMWGWSAPVVQRPNAIAQIGSGDFSGLGSLNLSHYSNAEFDEPAARFAESVDRSERAELNEQLQRIIARDTPFVTILFNDTISAVNTRMYDGWVFAKGTHAVNIFSFLP
jgi:peptide/nickel transport system substrate-binding protein